MIRTLRWLLVLPMATAGWFIAFAGAVTLHSLIVEFCPTQYVVSGLCTHELAFLTEDLLVWFGAFISAVFVVAFATRTAPALKSLVATGILIGGLGAAIWAYLETDALGALVGAFLGGFLTWLIIVRKHGWRQPSRYRQYELFI